MASGFLMTTCQAGAEAALKAEILRRWPGVRWGYWRPGFVTFRLPEGLTLPDDFVFRAVFARAHAFSLGQVPGTTTVERAEAVWRLLGDRPASRVHVWSRETSPPGHGDGDPLMANAVDEARQAIRDACPRPDDATHSGADVSGAARRGELVLDCVLVEPHQWWAGYHQAKSFASRWPGGMVPLVLPPTAVSRAWLKMEEALRWSGLPIPPGARIAELGSAPGGASQALLARGYEVLGVDPAEMHPDVLAEARFTHLRRRAGAAPRRAFRKIRWLTADMNVAPRCTLDIVEDIVTYPQTRIRGLLLTLKLIQWRLADEIPEYLDRIRSWGYNVVRARQLQHNRQEICVAALRRSPGTSRG